MIFKGIICLENELNESTKKMASDLRNMSIQTFILTGDNIYTALNVAQKCGFLGKNGIYIGTI